MFRSLLADDRAAEVTTEALGYLQTLFANAAAPGSRMAARGAAPLDDPTIIAASAVSLANDLLAALGT